MVVFADVGWSLVFTSQEVGKGEARLGKIN